MASAFWESWKVLQYIFSVFMYKIKLFGVILHIPLNIHQSEPPFYCGSDIDYYTTETFLTPGKMNDTMDITENR